MPSQLNQHGFSVASALDLGVGTKRLRGPDLERPFWGIRALSGSADTIDGLALAYAARMPPHAFYSHTTAAALWGIPLPWTPSAPLHVAVPPGHAVPCGRGVAGHRLGIDAGDVVQLSGLRLTSLARTWCDLGAMLSGEDLVAAGDFLIWRRRVPGLRLTPDDLSAAVGRFPGRRGRPLLERTLPLLSDRADSPPESVLRVRFAVAGLPRPAVNRELFDDTGAFLAMPDLAFLAYKVCFDYEGDHHRTDPRQWEKDISRVPRLEDAGWLHLRGSKADYRDSGELILRLKHRLRRRGWSG